MIKINKLNTIKSLDQNLKDFSIFLAQKSLASDQYLSLNMIYKTNMYKNKIFEYFEEQEIDNNEE